MYFVSGNVFIFNVVNTNTASLEYIVIATFTRFGTPFLFIRREREGKRVHMLLTRRVTFQFCVIRVN